MAAILDALEPVSGPTPAGAVSRLRASPRARPVCLAIALTFAQSACSRRSTEHQAATTSGKPSATSSAGVTPDVLPSSVQKERPAPVTPKVPPQLVACGERDFYRITRSALQVFEIAAQQPPPQIRGSRVVRQTTEMPVAEPLNVLTTARKGAVVIAKDGVLGYEPGQKALRRHAPIPTSAPLVAWLDPRRADSLRVHAVGDEKVREYSLAALSSAEPDSPPPPAQVPRQVESLEGFDGRLFTLLADETAFYSTPNGLVRRGSEARLTRFYALPAATTLLFADVSPTRYWAGDASGRVALWDLEQSASPRFGATVPGVVVDAAQEGERVAVLSIALSAGSYLPTVTIFSNGKELGRVDTGPSSTRQQPEVDVCLVAGRPWVVVAGRRWLQLLDWESHRLLAEW
jgi:hypothetical protein